MILSFVNVGHKCVLMGEGVFASSRGVTLRDESKASMSVGLRAGSRGASTHFPADPNSFIIGPMVKGTTV